jgi:hypothetical protein
MDPRTAADVSAGWGGDRGVLLANGEQIAFAWKLAYDPSPAVAAGEPDRAARAYAALTRALEKELGPAQTADESFACHERAERGPMAIRRVKGALVFVLGPASARSSAWTSAGNCALASKWTRDIAAARD